MQHGDENTTHITLTSARVHSDLLGRKQMPTHTSSLHWHIFLLGCKVNVKCIAGNDDVKVGGCELDGGPHMALSVRVITLLRL